MSVTVLVPAQLRDLTGGAGTIVLESAPGTVGGALRELRGRLPAVYDRVVTEQGEVRRHVNVFVGREDIRWSGGLETPLAAGSEVVILPSVSGG